MFLPRRRGGHEDDLPRAYPHLRYINGVDPIGLRILMEEEPGQVRRELEEDLRRLADLHTERLRSHVLRGAEEGEIERVRRVMGNEYELRKRENEEHLRWVAENVNTRGAVYVLRLLARKAARFTRA